MSAGFVAGVRQEGERPAERELVAVTVVDLGVGNLASVAAGLRRAGALPTVTTDPRRVAVARTLVLPGVGAFRPPRQRLAGELEAALREALAAGAWLLGICVGYQLLFAGSEEDGFTPGLGLLAGTVRRLPAGVPLPHIGWNPLARRAAHPLLDGIADGDAAYFVHSYAPHDVPAEQWLAATTHGVELPAIAGSGRVLGMQFHPEKSAAVGETLLRNFLALASADAVGGVGRGPSGWCEGQAMAPAASSRGPALSLRGPAGPDLSLRGPAGPVAISGSVPGSGDCFVAGAPRNDAVTTAASRERDEAPSRRRTPFTVFPAIDLRHGRVVRLLRGVDATRQVYGDDPLATAAAHARDGARWLHVVDLDAAFGEAPQQELLAALLAWPGRPALQLGGGLRTVEAAERALALGVERVVVGTLLATDPAAFADLARRHPGRVVPALDVAGGHVRVAGWTAEGPRWEEIAAALRGLPCPAVLVTAIDRDGTLAGGDLALTAAVGAASGLPALLSGGVAALDDLRGAAATPGVAGAIVGRALYAGAFTLPAALAAVAPRPPSGLLARVIPCLDVAGGRVVKGVRFAALTDQGDPAAAARRYFAQGADELVFLDVGATHEERDTGLAWVEAVAREVAIPLTVGGGVRSVEDARRLLLAGADKVAVNSAAVADPSLLTAIAERFGRQCVVLAVDAARVESLPGSVAEPGLGARPSGHCEERSDEAISDSENAVTPPPPRWEVRTHGGRRPTGRDAIEWIVEGVARGAGEVLLTSIDADGTRGGYDLELLAAASGRVEVPVIASGGAGGVADLLPALRAGAAAVLAASLFHLGEATVEEAKEYLAACGVPVRRVPSPRRATGSVAARALRAGSPSPAAKNPSPQGAPPETAAAHSLAGANRADLAKEPAR